MFVYSVRARTLKFLGLFIVSLGILIGVVMLGGEGSVAASAAVNGVNYSGIQSNEDRVRFIEQFGVMVVDEPLEEESFVMPDSFDRVILGYNEIQKKQGLDLSKYAKKRVTRYCYKVENYNSDGDVFVNLFVYRSRIVACDVSSANPDGFVCPLTLVSKSDLK